MARIYVGTSSWADHTRFYPADLPANQQIAYYARHFPIVEINSSFYRLMSTRNYSLWAERTPEGFLFDVKPYRQMTWHDRKNPPEDAQTVAFRDSLQPLRVAGKLGAVHFQFPPWFAHTPRNMDYILHVRELFPDDRVAVEFRHRSWLEGDHVPMLLDALRDAGVSLTVVDEPQIGSGSVPTLVQVTNPDLAIVRFHGRNAAKWYARTETTAERFNYLYDAQELREWFPRIGTLADGSAEVHVFFNNNAEDFAIQNARQMRQLLLEMPFSHEVVLPRPSDAHPQLPLGDAVG